MDHSAGISHLVSATAVTVAGMATGLSYEVLLAGFAGALVSLSYTRSVGLWRRAWSLVTATITSGYTAPVAASYLVNIIGDAGRFPTLVFAGFLIGLSAQVAIPGFLAYAKRKSRSPEGPMK